MSDLLWYLQRLEWIDALDILLVAFIFFWLLYVVRGTRAVPLLRGVILLIIIVTLLSGGMRLRALGWLTDKALPALLVAIPVVFQQELRRALERLGRAGSLLGRPTGDRATLEQTLSTITQACHTLAERRHGALIILERDTGLQEFIDTGILLNAVITQELLVTIFDPNTTLHDGAVIVRHGRALAAACVLPLSTAFLADRELGLRHRSAIGVTEEGDAIAVVVSEERGSISIAHNGRIIRNLNVKRLEAVLHAFYQPVLERAWPRWVARARRAFGRREKDAASLTYSIGKES
ncbi:MAG: diadenylate cyclase CdaA [Chloroflexota bacterium]|nr:diadenylate cyclase CdaA [Chloroflexota bacterium]